jgi:hypothetical protein
MSREAMQMALEPVAEIQAEDMGKPFNAIRVTTHFYAEVPAVGTKLYKAPPKREWVGLTDEEIQDMGHLSEKFDASNSEWFDRWEFARALEAKLREKNKC